EYADICEEFAKARGHSDEKLQLAKQLLETVSRLRRKLGMEVEKFKLELEADHAGVTSSIEDRLLREEDLRHHRQQQSLVSAAAVTNGHHDAALASLVGPDSPANSSTAASAAAPPPQWPPHSPLSSVGSSFGDVATPLRRGGGGDGGGLKRNRTSFFSGLEQPSLSSEFDQSAAVVGGASSDSLVAAFLSDVGLDEAAAGGVDGLSGEDNSRYCICHDVSHGEMIACENPACPFEWFHFACVGLTVAPRGSWYCPRCKSAGATAASPTGDTAAAAVPNSSPSSVRQRRSPQHRSSQQRPASAVVSATSRHGGPDDEAWLARLLAEVDLTAFHRRIREDLQVTKLRHFDFVKSDDLERLGLSRPSARRLLDAKQQQQQGLIDRLRLSSKALPSQPAAACRPRAAVEAPANLELLLPSAAAVSAPAPAGGPLGGAAGLAPMAPALSSGEQIYRLMLACWQLDPKSRPTFAALKAALAQAKPIEVLATRRFDEARPAAAAKRAIKSLCSMAGGPENFWWARPEPAHAPAKLVGFRAPWPARESRWSPRDISRPIKNSFIHTGHGGMNQDTWGQPGHIDDVYLRNPMDPEDLSRPGCFCATKRVFLPPTGLRTCGCR
uniref:non-specific protein-tyrosine kinase n=1 Tax=Macrostomum lignano TaxID=282301 RepID=A0A1I8F1D0_9PLAT